MDNMTRRSMLAGSATVPVAAALGEFSCSTPALAQAAQVGKQAPNFYRYKVGDTEVTVV